MVLQNHTQEASAVNADPFSARSASPRLLALYTLDEQSRLTSALAAAPRQPEARLVCGLANIYQRRMIETCPPLADSRSLRALEYSKTHRVLRPSDGADHRTSRAQLCTSRFFAGEYMNLRSRSFLRTFIGLAAVVVISLWATSAGAQCGSEASSCKNCHEVQGQDPVNNDGTGWHESHAFGDFCYICHAGNQQATDKDAAHVGMVPPLSDVKASCQSCHAADLDQRAEVYLTALGIDLNDSSTVTQATATMTLASEATPAAIPPTAANETASAVPIADSSETCAAGGTQLAVDDPNLVDYVHHYNQVVLGETPVNWGDVTLVGLIALVVVGGGGFVLFNENRLHRAAQTHIVEGEYPADVVEMLPALTNLKSSSRRTLGNILKHPEKSDKVLGLIDAVVTDDDQPEE